MRNRGQKEAIQAGRWQHFQNLHDVQNHLECDWQQQLQLTERKSMSMQQSVNELSSKYYRRLGEVWSEEMPERFMDNLLRFLEYEEKVYKLILPEEDSMQFNPRFESEMVPKLVPILMKHEQGLKMFFR